MMIPPLQRQWTTVLLLNVRVLVLLGALLLIFYVKASSSSSSSQAFCEKDPNKNDAVHDRLLLMMMHDRAAVTTPLQKELAAAAVSTLLEEGSDVSTKSESLSTESESLPPPPQPRRRRKTYPETNPHVCLAFLSCCNRIDLLNHTLAATIRHLEQDEPEQLRYEIAWVDNGSRQELVQSIVETYQIEHALPLEQNMGLALGMNLLIFQLCKAPYVLLLEEDWLYLDDIVMEQTKRRKEAIATSIALLEQGNMIAYDGRTVMGVFLRPETYSSFLTFPHADNWNSTVVDVNKALSGGGGGGIISNSSTSTSTGSSEQNEAEDEAICKNETTNDTTAVPSEQVVDFRIYCADTGLKSNALWGSYTNGAGLYRRSDLVRIGRMYGEPGDAFHDSYVEGNYAYRAGLQACHAAIRLSDDPNCDEVAARNCTAAFYHIGGGRGTRPGNQVSTKCGHFAWCFYDTPMYDKFIKIQSLMGHPVPQCTPAELEEHRQLRFKQTQTQQYQAEVQEKNKILFEKERAKRQQVREQAQAVLVMNKDDVRKEVGWMSEMTDAEIDAEARRLIRFADSPHPLDGFWDSHGRPLE